MNLLPIVTVIGFSPTTAFIDFARAYSGPPESAPPRVGSRLPLESPDGQVALANVVQHTLPQLLELAETIRGIVATNAGAVLVKGLGFERVAALHGEAVRDALVLALTSAIGEPTDHCADKRVMWPVRSRPVAAETQATFSERTGEAPLHTDSAFSPRPERYNALYVVRQSRCGGGHTVVVNGPRFLKDFAKNPQGADCILFLREAVFAYWVPDAFFTGQRFITEKILAEEPAIRFRHDCIERGFELCPDLATKEHRSYYALFRKAAESHASRTEFLMADGEMIVYDNTRLLHGRTDFQDAARHLIRVRMHERNPTKTLQLAS
jgi:alpha-ketoglutarate-dependent taurine dioxygenase